MILDKATHDYLHTLRRPSDPLLAEMEAYAAANGVPIAPRETAALLAMLARAAAARLVLEIGLAIGYSALHVARALPDYGKVVSLERDMHMAALARLYLARDPAGAKVEVLLGDAHDTLPGLRETFDMVFIDADKPSNPIYFEWAMRLTRPGSVIVVDNVVRQGAVADPDSADPSVRGTRRLNEMLAADRRVSATEIQTVGSKGYDGFALALVLPD